MNIKRNHTIKDIWEPNWLNSVLEFYSLVELIEVHEGNLIIHGTDRDIEEFRKILNSTDC